MAPRARVERAMDFRRLGNNQVRPTGIRILGMKKVVGMAGFEPACSCVRGRLDKPLLYIPTYVDIQLSKNAVAVHTSSGWFVAHALLRAASALIPMPARLQTLVSRGVSTRHAEVRAPHMITISLRQATSLVLQAIIREQD